MKKTGLSALVAACCLVAVSADAAPRAKGKKTRTAVHAKPKADASKSEAPKAHAPKTESSKSETSKTETTKTDASASLLTTDCSKGETDDHCKRVAWVSGGTLGAGPAIRGTSGFPNIGDGFIDGNRLVVAVELGSQSDENGGIFGIDLTTGDRTLLSGKYEDPAKGPVTAGTGVDLGYVGAVARAGSSWVAFTPKGIVRIDPKTGNRTLDTMPATCTGTTMKLNPNRGTIAAAPDGTVYVAVSSASFATGILAYKSGACSVVTMTGADGFESKGGGPTMQSMDQFRSMRFIDGKIWALHGISNSVITVDVATGNRARISSGETSTKVGSGDTKNGYKSLAVVGSKVWSTGGWTSDGNFLLTEAAVSNGARTGHGASKWGPASHDGAKALWAHPTKALFVTIIDNAVVLVDPATGQSNILSD